MFKKQSPVRLKDKPKAVRRIIDPNKRMLLRQLIIGCLLFTFLGLIIAGIWYGTRIASLTITTVEAKGGQTIDAARVEVVVQEKLGGTYAGLIPRRFAWWYPEADLYAAVRTIPRLKDPVIERTSGTALSVAYDEYVPYALWCAERDGNSCLFVDEGGYAFSVAPSLTGGAMIRYRTLGVAPTVGNQVATREQLTTMEEFIALVSKQLAFEIESVETDTAGDVFYILAAGGELKASLRTPSAEVFDNLRTILTAPEFTHIKPGNFQYIDLRFGSKVFVNEETGMTSTTDSVSTSTASTTAQ